MAESYQVKTSHIKSANVRQSLHSFWQLVYIAVYREGFVVCVEKVHRKCNCINMFGLTFLD